MKVNPKNVFWASVGVVCLGLGTVGIILPILPTTPLYMATLFCFAKSSKRLHKWFESTSLYKKHLKSFAQNRAMTMRTKFSVTGTVTILMAFGFAMMKNSTVGRAVMCVVWLFHIIYFFGRVKTIQEKQEIKDV